MFPHPAPDAGLLAALRGGLEDAGFTEPGICERYGLPTIHEVSIGKERPTEPTDALDVLIRLLMEGGSVARETVRRLLPPGLLAALADLELLRPASTDPASVEGEIALYPVEGLYIASDRSSEFPLGREDGVFPAISRLGAGYLGALPRSPCERFLELCSGSGIAALVAARSAGHVWAIDIAARSTEFARFNVALNGIANASVLQGDLYAPAQGLVFDRIVAHPPYVPSLERRQIYRDGGQDGEELTRRVIAEAPAYLAPGGRLYVTCVATERSEAPLEARVREMLGPQRDEFDVLVLVSAVQDPLIHFAGEMALKRRTIDEGSTLVRLMRERDVTALCSACIVLQKHAAPAAALTIRRRRGGSELGDAIERVFRWYHWAAAPGALERVAGVRPRLTPGARLHLLHGPEGGRWQLESCRLLVDGALSAELAMSPAAAECLAWCDGEHTAAEHVARLVAAGAAPADAPPTEFYRMILGLLQEGVLEAELPPD